MAPQYSVCSTELKFLDFSPLAAPLGAAIRDTSQDASQTLQYSPNGGVFIV